MKKQESYWTYKAGPIPELRDLPPDTFRGTEKDWQSLSPGMRREIYRMAVKKNPKRRKSARLRRAHVKINPLNPRKRKRYLSPTQSREYFDRMYERKERDREAKLDAFLRTPEGEAWRQAENRKVIERLKKNPKRKTRKRRKGPRKMTALQRRYFGKGHKPVRAAKRRARRNPLPVAAGISAKNLATFRRFLAAPKGAKLIKR